LGDLKCWVVLEWNAGNGVESQVNYLIFIERDTGNRKKNLSFETLVDFGFALPSRLESQVNYLIFIEKDTGNRKKKSVI
jgi:hypothetical protein